MSLLETAGSGRAQPRIDGNKIRQLRFRQNLEPSKIVHRIVTEHQVPVTINHLYRIETNVRRPSAKLAAAIAAILGVTVFELQDHRGRR